MYAPLVDTFEAIWITFNTIKETISKYCFGDLRDRAFSKTLDLWS